MPVAGPSYAISSDTPVLRLRALLAHPSSSLSRRYPLARPDRNNSGVSETDVTPIVDRAKERHKGKMKSLIDDIPRSPPLSPLLQNSGSPIQIRTLVSTSAASFQSVPDSPLKSSKSEGEVRHTMSPSSTPHGTTPLISSASQDGPEVATCKADVTPLRVDGDSLAYLNYTAMTGAFSPVPFKRAPRVTLSPPASSSELIPTTSSSWTPLPRANSEPERRSMPETAASNGLFTPIDPLSHAQSLHARTQILSNEQTKFGSIRGKSTFSKCASI